MSFAVKSGKRCAMIKENKRSLFFVFILLAAALPVLLSSCVRTVITQDNAPTRAPRRDSYAKLNDYKLDLSLAHPGRTLAPDEEFCYIFRLKNFGDKALRIDEWFMNDAENMRIYYRPLEKNIISFDRNDKAWKSIEPIHPPNANHFELIISPGNVVFVEKKINWSTVLPVKELTGKRYLIVAELALTSVDVRSGLIEIEFK